MRAVIYARCSTEEESQKDALVKQVREGQECVSQKGWTLVDSYIESRSGTTTKGRTEYNRLYEELQEDKFDVIVVKSQDRLMRNTKDWYLFADRLSSEQKKLFIYIEQKFYSSDDALIAGIKAILAEEYSRELSKKSNNAHRNRQKNNGPAVLNSNTYGYRKLPDKSIVIAEEEAAVKKRMYELCAAGFGTRTIAAILKNDGILNRKGKPFSDSAILRMIHNPLNKGTVVMNRKHYDFESKRTLKIPAEEQYIYENKIPAIVSEELWEQANQEIAKRAGRIKNEQKRSGGKNPGKFHLSGKVYCGLCGNPYYRKARKRYKDGKAIYEWKCRKYLETGRNAGKEKSAQIKNIRLECMSGCDNVHLNEEVFYYLLEQICDEKYSVNQEAIIRNIMSMMKKAVKGKDLQQEMVRIKEQKKQIKEQMNKLVDKLLEGVLSDHVYGRKQKELEKNMNYVQEKLNSLEQEAAQEPMLQDRICMIESALKEKRIVEKAGVACMLDKMEKIVIFPEHMELQFSTVKTAGMQGEHVFSDEGDNYMRIEYGNLFHYKKRKKEEREQIIDLMKDKPAITAKEIAEELGIGLPGANYRIRILKKEGRIRFEGKGGKGKWEVLEP